MSPPPCLRLSSGPIIHCLGDAPPPLCDSHPPVCGDHPTHPRIQLVCHASPCATSLLVCHPPSRVAPLPVCAGTTQPAHGFSRCATLILMWLPSLCGPPTRLRLSSWCDPPFPVRGGHPTHPRIQLACHLSPCVAALPVCHPPPRVTILLVWQFFPCGGRP